MKKIVLYGELGKRFGKYHTFSVRNAAEAIRALKANFRGFASFMTSAHEHGLGFKIFSGHSDLDYGDLANPTGEKDVIRIVPVLMGSKSGWVRILIGAAVVYTGSLIAGAGAASGNPLVAGLGTAVMSYGVSMIIGGVVQLLSKPPATPGSPESRNRDSYIFNGPENTSAQGRPVPVVYGEMIVGSAVISAGIETYETS